MSILFRISFAIFVVLLCTAGVYAGSTPSTSSKTGSHNWSSSASWTAGVPNSSVDVIIVAGSFMTVDGNFGALSLTFNGGGAGSSITIPEGDSLYVFNATTLNAPGNGNTTTITINGKMTTSGVNSSQMNLKGTTTAQTNLIFGTNGVLSCAYYMIVTNAGGAAIDMTNGGLFKLGALLFGSPTITAGTGTVSYTGTGAVNGPQTVYAMTYNNLTLNGDHTKTISTGSVTVNGALTMAGTASASAPPTWGALSSLVYAGSSAQTTGTELPSTMPQLVVINNAAGVTLGGSKEFDGGVTMTTGALSLGGNSITYGSSSTLTYNGSSAQTTGAELPSTMAQLVIITNAAGVILSQSTEFDGGITCTSGNLNTNSNTATLGGGTLSESDGNEVMGILQANQILSQSVNNTFYGMGIEIDALGAEPGPTSVTRQTGVWYDKNGHQSISRVFQVGPSNNSGLNATLVYHYFPSELNGNTAGSLDIDATPDGSTWTPLGASDNGTTHLITATGVNSIRILAAINASTPLAIHLNSFTANAVEHSVNLQWSTLTETDNYGFYVQRGTSQAGPFANVSGLIPGAGTSLDTHSYSYTDASVPAGTFYYRIRDVNTTGSSDYSAPIKFIVSGVEGVNDGSQAKPKTFALNQNYPNPFNPTTTIQYQLPAESFVHLTLYNTLGQEIRTLVNGMQQPGYKSVQFDASNLPSGIYIYRIQAGAFTDIRKMVLMK